MGYASGMKRRTKLVLILALSLAGTLSAEEKPQVWGYGVKGCEDYLSSWKARGGEERAGADFISYEEWLAGLVTGLTLASGEDVLRSQPFEESLQRIAQHCEKNIRDDFFNASLAVLRGLSKPKRSP